MWCVYDEQPVRLPMHASVRASVCTSARGYVGVCVLVYITAMGFSL